MTEDESVQDHAGDQQAAGAESEPARVSRKALYKMVLSEPMLKLAARFGFSQSLLLFAIMFH